MKACAAKQFREHVVPEKGIVNDFYTHRLDKLITIAGLKTALDAHAAATPQFRDHWTALIDWHESSRYDHKITETKARQMLAAVADASSGVLTWLKTHW